MEKDELKKIPTHIAFIMDGNGRWAKARGLQRHFGHRQACLRLKEIIETCDELGIKYSSYFAFSTENWNRPQDEIDHLMDYLEEFFAKELEGIKKRNGKILISGDLSRIREQTRNVCLKAIEETKEGTGHVMNVCLNYGGRDELAKAAKAFAQDCLEGKKKPEDIDDKNLSEYLYNPEIPDVDLLIRTSGEERISNFMLYRLAYAEFVFTDVKWPDFHRKELLDCLMEYQKRDRRYGGLKNA